MVNGNSKNENKQIRKIPYSDPLTAIEEELKTYPTIKPNTTAVSTEFGDIPRCVGGLFGYLSYDAVHHFEPSVVTITHINSASKNETSDSQTVPDACFVEPQVLAVFDNRKHKLLLYARSEALLDQAEQALRREVPADSLHATSPARPSQTQTNTKTITPNITVPIAEPREDFIAAVKRAKEYILSGDIIQIVLSRRFTLPRNSTTPHPFSVYRALRTINPSPYLFYFSTPQRQLAGASPEVMVRVTDGTVVVRPIAGTRPRGTTAKDDEQLATDLLADEKERAEHLMLVDLGRNDVGRVAAPGSVTVPQLMTVERYSHVMHIVSEVQGTLNHQYSSLDALRAAFPAGTLSGAPKVRAMQLIQQLEGRPRGIYGGAVGYIGNNGDADFGIAIRTMVADKTTITVQAGAGIVADSDPEKEADETEHKAQGVLRAIAEATPTTKDT